MAIFAAIGDLLKKKPKVPPFEKIDVGEEARKATESNIQNLPRIAELGGEFNELSRGEQLKNLDFFLGKGFKEQIGSNLMSAARGELPSDVQDLISRRAAEFGAGSGVGGSPFGRNLELRDLGLTSLARSDFALDAAARWLNTAQQGQQSFDFGSMFISPQTQLQQANVDRQAVFQRQFLEEQLNAAFDPRTIWGNAFNKFDDQIIQLASAYLGGMGGGAPSGGGSPRGGGGMSTADFNFARNSFGL